MKTDEFFEIKDMQKYHCNVCNQNYFEMDIEKHIHKTKDSPITVLDSYTISDTFK